ncbi:MAG: ferredoxin [Acidimicrobiia bacterium]|nr:ferredoxin [Acidimicrobiia bacterium]
MKLWIDQQLCTGNGICAEIAPSTIVMLDGLAYAADGQRVMAAAQGNPEGAAGIVAVPSGAEEDVLEAADVCPAECIYVEV